MTIVASQAPITFLGIRLWTASSKIRKTEICSNVLRSYCTLVLDNRMFLSMKKILRANMCKINSPRSQSTKGLNIVSIQRNLDKHLKNTYSGSYGGQHRVGFNSLLNNRPMSKILI